MNIKYVPLLSLLCVAGAQAETATKQFDIATKEYRNCRNSWENLCGYGLKTYDLESKAFEQARQEFLNPHRENLQKEKKKSAAHRYRWQDTYWWNLKNIQKNDQKMSCKIDSHKVIIEAFEDKNGYNFLNSNKSTDEFAEHTLNNMLTTKNELSESQLKYMFAAKYEIMEMIKQQS
jgi:hypothetical protein